MKDTTKKILERIKSKHNAFDKDVKSGTDLVHISSTEEMVRIFSDFAKEFIEDGLLEYVKHNIIQFMTWWLCVCGDEMVKTNAENMNHSAKITIKNKRYKIEGKYTIKEI